MEEKQFFVYGLDEQVPSWFITYEEKVEINYHGFSTAYVYPTEGRNKVKMYRVGDTIRYEDLYELW